MQRNPEKLKEAHNRRGIGKALLFLTVFPVIDYAFFLASGGYRDLFGLGHWNVLLLLVLAGVLVIILKPVYQLEKPFRYQLDQKRKAK